MCCYGSAYFYLWILWLVLKEFNLLKEKQSSMIKIFTRCWLDVCVPLKSICWNPNPQWDWKWGVRKVIRSWGWSLLNGTSVLIKETPDCCLVLSLTCEDTTNWKWPPATQKEDLHLAPWSQIPASRAVRNKSLWIINHSVSGILYSNPNKPRDREWNRSTGERKVYIWGESE